MLNGHGNSHTDLTYPVKIDFSSNVWHTPLNEQFLSHLKEELSTIVNYPPADAGNLQQAIANHHAIGDQQVCVTNGATEAFYLIAHAFQSKTSAIFTPSFSEYQDAAEMYNHHIRYYSELKMNVDLNGVDLVWIGNPNNPDGKILTVSDVNELLVKYPQTCFAIDEAYGDVCDGFESAIELIERFNNLVVIKSMTKQCVIPGLRLGYFLSNADLTKKIAALRMPWSVNALAIAAGKYIFSHYDHFYIDTHGLKMESQAMQTALNVIDGIEVFESDTNYFLCKLQKGKSDDLKSYLLKHYGFLIRDAANFKGLDASYFRVSIQGDIKNQLLIGAIKEYMKNAN